MSCIHRTACQLASAPSAFSLKTFQLNSTSICPSLHLDAKFPKVSLKLTSITSRCQQAPVVCLFGGKGKSEAGNEGSQWKVLEDAVVNLRKEESVENVLRQQIKKQDYYDGGSGGKPPGEGGGGGGDGFGEAEDDDLSGMWDEFVQVILATIGFIFLYIYILESEEINVLAKDLLKFLFTRQLSIRLRRLINQWKRFLEKMKEKEEYDPYWLESAIINTPTWYDSPDKYRYIFKVLNSRSGYDADGGDDDDDDANANADADDDDDDDK